jgi:cardiolipin synthase (CMP-forming)
MILVSFLILLFTVPTLGSQSTNIWRHVPNAISIARLCASAVMLASVLLHRVEMFRWLLLFCLLSDLLDGLIARTFHLTSRVGALLDSVADVATMFTALLGVLVFQQLFVAEHYPGLLLVMGLYIIELIASFWRYGRLSSFHSLLTRAAAFIAGVFVMSLFLWEYSGWLYHGAVLVYVLALLEEMLLIYFLPEWQCDVGGIYRLLSKRAVSDKSLCAK